MTKKHFIALADAVARAKPSGPICPDDHEDELINAAYFQWEADRDMLADFCQAQNPGFDRARWLGYIAGENGFSGGAVKKGR